MLQQNSFDNKFIINFVLFFFFVFFSKQPILLKSNIVTILKRKIENSVKKLTKHIWNKYL